MSHITRQVTIAITLALFVFACGGDENPNNPTPQATNRVLRLDGTLNFGDVQVGQTNERIFRIFNDGNATLTVAALQPSGGGSYVAS